MTGATWSENGRKFAEIDGQVVEVTVLDPVDTDPVWKDWNKHRPPIKSASQSSTQRSRACRERKKRGARLVTVRLEITEDYLRKKIGEGQIPPEALDNPDELNGAIGKMVHDFLGL